jgi:filamentous hemagglutinin family protein
MHHWKPIQRIGIFFFLSACLISLPSLVSAQLSGIILDDTLGNPREALTGPDFVIDESKGAVVDNNLFHSFEEFNIVTLPDTTIQSATFTNIADKPINNVVSRVTGGFESEINGALFTGPNLAGANFWFLNPSGVFFGPNASINIDGAFHVGAADFLEFASGERFSANSAWPPILSVANPVEFGFLNQGASLAKITLNGSFIFVEKGISLTAGNSVELLPTSFIVTATFDGTKSGDINIKTPLLSINNAAIRTLTFANGNSGNINIDSDSIRLVEGGTINTDVTDFSIGNGGNILISAANDVSLVGLGSFITTSTSDFGNAGAINIETPLLSLQDGASVQTSTSWVGNAGIIDIEVESLLLKNGASIFTNTISFGNGGNIFIKASKDIFLREGSLIATSTSGLGTAGTAGTIDIKNTPLLSVQELSAIQSSTTGDGNAGIIDIEVESLHIKNGGAIVSTPLFGSLGSGNGGDIFIKATNDISLIGSDFATSFGSSIFSGTFSSGTGGNIDIDTPVLSLIGDTSISSGTLGVGDAGNIDIEVENLLLKNGSSIFSDTFSDGDGGNILITATNNISLLGTSPLGAIGSTISANTSGPGSGGIINITTPFLSLQDSSFISSVSLRNFPGDIVGNGGSIFISGLGGELNLQGGSLIIVNSIDSPGNAGNISLKNFGNIVLNNSRISSSSTGLGEAGNISIGSPHVDHASGTSIFLINSAIKTESLFASGGDIDLRASYMIHLIDSVITTNSAGSGGNIFIDPIFLIFDGTIISANAIDGNGGNITLIADHLFVSPDSIIEATSQFGTSGQISGDSPESDTTAGTAALKASYSDSSKLLKKSCSLQGAEDNAGSLVVAKSRGLPASPEEMLMAYDPSILDKSSSSYALASAIADADDDKFKPVQVASANAMKKGDKAFRGGDYDTAEEELKIASSLLSGTDNKASRGATLQKLGQTQQALGKYQESLSTLNESLKIATETGQTMRQASILSSMGNANIALGKTEEAEKLLQRGIVIASNTDNPEIVTSSLNNLGNLYTSMGNHEKAMETYRKSADSAKVNGQKIVFAKAVSNEARAALLAGDTDRVRELLEGARQWMQTLDDSTEKAYILVHLAKSFELLAQRSSEHRALGLMGAHDSLHSAIQVSEAIGENRARSYAQGNLGKLYQNSQRYMEAMYLTRQALESAQLAEAPESIYRWHWQQGKILWEIDQKDSAIDSYRRAVKILDETRQETMARYASSAGYFNKVISPVYLDLVDALIQVGESAKVTDEAAKSLLEARNIMEQLKAAELREYFQDECITEFEAKETGLETVAKNAAVVYPIMLPDRVDILVSLPSGMKRYTTKIKSDDLVKGIKKFRRHLQTPDNDDYLDYSQKLYDILVRPYEKDMVSEGISTLVFLPHDALHSIPVAALHDGEKFLVQKYALAVTPSLALVDPKPLDRSKIKILLAGISESVQGLPALPAVPNELASIKNLLGGDILLNQNFTVDNFKKALGDKEVSIVHIASHGSFTGNENGNFLLAFDGKLSINQLNKSIGQTKFRKNPVELLVLSACETAAGDEKAALGLAGAAIQAGARSVMGSLWSVSDEGTAQLVEEFYRQLKDPSISKATALQRAQKKLMQNHTFQHPYFWSPFLMINNWL